MGNGDQLPEFPIVLGGQSNALGMGNAPHDGRGHGRTKVDVKLGERCLGIESGSAHRGSGGAILGSLAAG